MERPRRAVPLLGAGEGESHILGPGEYLVGIMDHGFQIFHELKAVGHLLAVAADMLQAQNYITMRGQVLCLGIVRVQIAAGAVGDDHHGKRPTDGGQMYFDGNLALRGR
jgi:hypothetical protein